MLLRIVIDGDDAEGQELPLTLNAFNLDGGKRSMLDIDGGSLVGDNVPDMLRSLADQWAEGRVTDGNGRPMPTHMER